MKFQKRIDLLLYASALLVKNEPSKYLSVHRKKEPLVLKLADNNYIKSVKTIIQRNFCSHFPIETEKKANLEKLGIKEGFVKRSGKKLCLLLERRNL